MIVLITGASAGFGAAMARSFVQSGHQVIATARRKSKLDALAAELGERLLPVELDVTDRAAVQACPHSCLLVLRRWTYWSTTPGWPWAWSQPIRPIWTTGTP